MNEAQVTETLRSLDPHWVSPNRVRLLAELSRIYEGEGVLSSERAPTLHRACPSAGACWADAQNRISSHAETRWSGDEDGSIFWPWIGEGYRSNGVVLVGLNLNHAGGWWSITVEYAVKAAEIPGLEQGRRATQNHSKFAYRSAATVMAVLASRDGVSPVESPDPHDAPAAFQRVALVQAVKCAPLNDRSWPTDEMRSNCPPRYLARELEILEPAVLIALGEDAKWGIEQAGAVRWTYETEHYRRGTLALAGGRQSEVFVVPHPQSFGRRWPLGQAALVADLLEHPVADSANVHR